MKEAIAIAPLITDVCDAALIMRTMYQCGKDIRHAVGELRNELESLEDAIDKNDEASFVEAKQLEGLSPSAIPPAPQNGK